MGRIHRSLAWLLVAGCAAAGASGKDATGGARPTERRLEPPHVRIVSPELAAARSVRSEPVMVPFGVNQNGTELVYTLLEHAARAGARYVADLKMYMTFRWRGTPVECRTAVLLEGDPRLAAASPGPPAAGGGGAYQTDVAAYQPQPVDFVAEDRELLCRRVVVPITRWRRVRESDRSAEGSRMKRMDADAHELVTETEEREVCDWHPITRRTTRYDYEVKLGFVPPNWDHLQERFARHRIIAGRPTCYSLAEEELAKQPMYRVTATAYVRGKVAQRLPDGSAAMDTINPTNYELEKRTDLSEGCG